MVDTLDLGSSAARCEGSSPFRPTIWKMSKMDIKEIKSDKFYKEYSLVIPFTELDEKINAKIQNLIPNVELPGFRKGKAPISIVRKKYENNVLNEVLDKMVQSKASDLIEQKKLNLFRQPKVNLKKYEKNKPIEIEIQIDLQPEIQLKDYKKINLNQYNIEVGKKLVDEQFNNFIKSQKNFKKIENSRPIKKSDRAFLNLKTNDNEIPEYLREQKNLPLDTDSEIQILPNLSEKIIKSKLKEGDKIDLSFDLSEVLKNKQKNNVYFNIEIISVEEKIEFKLDKNFLEKNGFKKEDDIRNVIKKNIEEKYNEGIKQIEKKQLMDILDQEYKFDLPERILKEDFDEIWGRIENAKKNGNLDEDDKGLSVEKLKKRYKDISNRRVKLALLLQYISKEENISVSENELSKELMNYASKYPGQEKQIIEYFKKNPSSIETLKGPLLEQKVIDKIISKANVKNKKISETEYKDLEVKTFNIKKENKKKGNK